MENLRPQSAILIGYGEIKKINRCADVWFYSDINIFLLCCSNHHKDLVDGLIRGHQNIVEVSKKKKKGRMLARLSWNDVELTVHRFHIDLFDDESDLAPILTYRYSLRLE